jgi:hypothetical protein
MTYSGSTPSIYSQYTGTGDADAMTNLKSLTVREYSSMPRACEDNM